MPLYDYRCPQGHAFEQMAPVAARERQDCPVCGQASGKVVSRVSLGGQASPGLAMDQMPQTWRGTYEGHPEYVGQLRRLWEARQKLEDTYEELRGDRRPVLAHEGRYAGAPLRAGDPVPGAAREPGVPAAPAPGGPPAPAHGHSHAGPAGPAESPKVRPKEPPTTL